MDKIQVNGTKWIEGMDSSSSSSSSSIGNTNTSSTSVSYDTPTDIFYTLFNQSNLMLIVYFLGIYFVIYFIVQLLSGGQSDGHQVVRIFDLVGLAAILFYAVSTVLTTDDAGRAQKAADLYQWWKDTANSPMSMFSIGLFILLLYAVVYIVGIPMTADGKPIVVALLENGAWILLLTCIIVVFFRMVLGISITDAIDKWINQLPTTADSDTSSPTKKNTISGNTSVKNEVFNIRNNMYTYDDAQSVCASYGARLASYSEVEEAYQDGGEWCNYGWSEGQMALFPTQKSTWELLQKNKNPKIKQACGRPGVNGGFIDNPEVRFGINCYGVKPKPKDADIARMADKTAALSTVPKSTEDIIMEKKIQFWKDNADKLLQINSYNNQKWSEY